jgi:hypothetical protein
LSDNYRVYFSKDNGVNWALKNDGVTHDNFNFDPHLRKGYDGTMYLYADGKTFQSNDSSQGWTQIQAGGRIIRDFGPDDSVIYRTTSTGFYLSKDRGKTYAKQSDKILFDFAFDRLGRLYAHDPDDMYLLWVSKNEGKSWEKVYTSIQTRLLAFDTSGFVFSSVYTQGGAHGLWRTVTPLGLSGDHRDETVATIYPNPISSTAIIKFQSPIKNLEVTLFNIIGERVLHSAHTYIMTTELPLDTSKLPDGLYYCHLKIGDYIETKKIIVSR